MKIKTYILVSVLTCKELGRCHSHLYNRKTEQTQNQWLFLGSSENRDQRTSCHSKTGEKSQCRESQLRYTYLEQTCWSHKLVGTHHGNFDELLEAECGLVWEGKLLAASVLEKPSSLPLGTPSDSHSHKVPFVTLEGEGEDSLLWHILQEGSVR